MKKISVLLWLITVNFLSITQAFSAEDKKIISWKIDNSGSTIGFVADQNSTLIKGTFSNFTGTINFNKSNLKDSNVNIIIDLNSLGTSMTEATTYLKEKNWFNTKQFPNAEFRSQKFTQISENKFHAEGFLKLKGVQLPLGVDFYFDKYSPKQAVVIGETKINRVDFGVGVKNENGVKDLVEIKFKISAHN